MRYAYLIIIISFISLSCDDGLAPIQQTGFAGTVKFIGEWNPNAKLTHVVLFKDPLLSVNDFSAQNLKYVSDTIPNGSQVYRYSTTDEALISSVTAGEYSYLAVAQSKLDYLTLNREDWFVAAIFSLSNDGNPSKLIIPASTFVDSVNFICNFNNPPPQPPGGTNKLLKQILINHFGKIKE